MAKARMLPRIRTLTDPQEENPATFPIARLLNAFMEWVAGNSLDSLPAISGSISCGNIKPPSNMDVTNTNCDQRIAIFELDEITPIRTLILAEQIVVITKTIKKNIQLSGSLASNRIGALMKIITATIN